MKSPEIIELLHNIGIIPVVKLDSVDDAIPLAEALINGNLPCAEVTFRTDCAAESIRLMNQQYPELLVGAGTVLTIEQVDQAVENGAKFIVSPGLNPEVVKYCLSKEIPIVPGVANASDIEVALSLGLDVVKFFPAEVNGGLPAINALSGPFPKLKFIPTGGVSTQNMNSYLASDKIVAVGGSWMVKDSLIKQGRFLEIEKISKDAVLSMLNFKLAHVGLNPSPQAYNENLEKLSKLLSAQPKETSNSHFVGDYVELMKNGRGQFGHLALSTPNVERAKYFLENQGFTFDESTIKYENNTMKLAYLNEEIAGFALHLVKE